MDYVLIMLAVGCFVAQFAFTKVYEGSLKQTTVTGLVMLVAMGLIGTVLYLFVGVFQVHFSLFSVLIAIVYALVMIPYYMIGLKVISFGSLAVYSLFMMLGGMLVPFFYGVLFLGEKPSISQLVGTFVLVACIALQSMGQRSGESGESGENVEKTSKRKILFFVLCLLIFFLNGMTGVLAKIHQIGNNSVDEVSFTVISCFFIALLSFAMFAVVLFTKRRGEKIIQAKTTLKRKPLLAIVALSVASHTGNFFILKAASRVPASLQFPMISGGVIVLSALVSAFVFREKLTKTEWGSVLGSFVATCLFAF